MTNWQFSTDMINILKNLKGKIFVSYDIDTSTQGESYCVMRINTDSQSVIIKNEEEEIEMLENELITNEEAARFSCHEADAAALFVPGLIDVGVRNCKVNEKIEKISIITDVITNSAEGMNISIDMAIVIETEQHTYIFSKSACWFDEVIYINVDKHFDEICPISDVIDTWNNDGEWEVLVERKITVL